MTTQTTQKLTRDTIEIPYRHVTTHFIDGAWRESRGQDTFEVTDPATNTVWGSVPVGNEDDVNAAVEAAHAAFTTGPWSKTAPTERAEIMLRIADEIEKRSTELSLTNTLENGSPVAETSGAAANAASIFRYFATLAPELEADDVRPFPNGQGESLVRKDPIGVCALIAPWNFPIHLMVTKLAPALLAGCTLVMKPAPPTPISLLSPTDPPTLLPNHVPTFPIVQGQSLVREAPIGLCPLIAPWNLPINLMVTKLPPALPAGCTVVMKPASPTPLSFRIIVDAVTAAGVPAGVVNLVTGPGRMGDLMVRHPKVAKVAFTGSTPVGRHIAAACGELLRPVTLELGGKSSAIVMEDADLDEMSGRLIRSCMRNTGQTCYISTRILAPASRYEEVVDMVTETIATAPQGDPLDPATVFGPSANLSQYNSVLGHLESASAEGARVTTAGNPAQLNGELADGLFIH